MEIISVEGFAVGTSYKRNNRTDGCKALRCFPACSPSGHRCSGYCGSGARITLTAGGVTDMSYWTNRFVVVCEFRPQSVQSLSSVGTMSRAALSEYLRTTDKPMLPYIQGKISSIVEKEGMHVVDINFNPHNIAWHYGWKSSKWTSYEPHVLDMIFFEDNGFGRLRVIHAFISSTFTITCTRAESVALRKTKATLKSGASSSTQLASGSRRRGDEDGGNKDRARKKQKISESIAPDWTTLVPHEQLMKGLHIASSHDTFDVKHSVASAGGSASEDSVAEVDSDAATDNTLADDTTSVSTMTSYDSDSEIGSYFGLPNVGGASDKKWCDEVPAYKDSNVFGDGDIFMFAAL